MFITIQNDSLNIGKFLFLISLNNKQELIP